MRYPLHAIAEIERASQSDWTFIARHTPAVPGLADLMPIRLRAMIHYVTWNRMIEMHASWRYRIEDANISFVCAQAGLVLERCYKHIPSESSGKGIEAERGPVGSITWSELDVVSKVWARELRAMAVRYGYDRAGIPIPQPITFVPGEQLYV